MKRAKLDTGPMVVRPPRMGMDRQTQRTLRSYEETRRPWRVESPEEKAARQEAEVKLWRQERRRRGAQAGAVLRRMRLPVQEETTAQVRGCFPFLAGQGMAAPGAYIGQDVFTRGAFLYDMFRLYNAGMLSNPNLLIAGVIGSGKSSLLKTLCLRLWAFGIHFVCPADTKGEMAEMAKAVGAPVVHLGHGRDAINPLWAPPCPAGMDPQRYKQQIAAHRLLLLRALGETASGRPLTAIEDLLIELALTEATRADASVARLATPTLPALVDIMLSPTPEMAASVPIDHDLLCRESLSLALRFRSMVRGSLQGVFDGQTVDVDLAKPGFVIDISRIRASDAAVALTMTCGQALTDLILSFSNDRWLKILDECWRQIRYPAIVRRISEGQKLARGDASTTGSATLIALHRISDLMGAGPDVRDLAMGLLADTSTRVIYKQASDQLDATREALSLTDVEASYLPMLGQGTALWKVGEYSSIVNHVVLRDGMEWDLIQTDSRMGEAQEEEAYHQTADPEAAMAAEIGEGAA